MEKRKSGFYWVKLSGDCAWLVAEYKESSRSWFTCGDDCAVNKYIMRVNENRIMSPDEWE